MTLPKPNGQFVWTQEAWGPALRCSPLSECAPHLFTTRRVQLGGPAVETGEAWEKVAAALGVAPGRLLRLRQVHGAHVITTSGPTVENALHDGWPEADAAISNDPSIGLAIRVADCVPLLLADRRTGAVAAVHAGWRGTAAGAALAAVAALTRTYGAHPPDLTAAIGPSIGPCCYIVAPELLEKFTGHPEASAWFAGDQPLHLDLWRATRDQLMRAGLARENIHACELCTATHVELFCSFRMEGDAVGRMAGVIRTP
jgi:purine-nucleoside/S-methyl-5'-thioadenosine phosphorylase / adenosine deaminase